MRMRGVSAGGLTRPRGSTRLRFATFCSGIEGVSLSWEPLGMVPVFFSEIEKFPCAVLAHRWPGVPNLGDLTRIDGRPYRGRIDIVWGSTPCQAFSFAGRRKGLGDARGQLTLAFLDRVEEIQPTYVCWENVKGVLSDRNNAFGCLVGALAGEDGPLEPPGGRWAHAGYVLGPTRAVAWRLFDAEHGGVPQRRERVFVVASARNGADPRDILFEREGLRRDHPPRRETGEAVAALTARGVGTCGADDNQAQAGHLIAAFGQDSHYGGYKPGVATLQATGGFWGGGSETIAVDFANASLGEIIGTLDTGLAAGNRGHGVVCATGDVTHALKAEGADASEDGTGRGNPIIAFSSKDYGADAAVELSPTLRAMGHSASHANAWGQIAVAFQGRGSNIDLGQHVTGTIGGNCDRASGGAPCIAYGASMRARDGGATVELTEELSNALRAADGGGSKALVLLAWIGERIGARVRRLTPRECERLQGLPDDHTLIPYRGKPAEKCPDGPRYKAIGNGLALPDVIWIGQRILRFHPARRRVTA